jgi:hypothetical protein
MKIRQPSAVIAALAVAFVVSSAGCSRDTATPVAETQTQTPARTANQPMTVTGCLRAGEAAETFVLTTSGTDVATYNLVGVEGVNLHDHTGKQVEVNGVLVAQQQTASRAAAPADDKATGTAGTPSVETRTTVDIRQIEVNSIRRTGGDCK